MMMDEDYCATEESEQQIAMEYGGECQTIQLPPGSKTLAQRFEESRQDSLSMRWPILSGNICHHRRTMLDDAPAEELFEAADAILLAHAARMAIRSVAKVEEAWAQFDGNNPSLKAAPQSEIMTILMEERDKATDFYHKVREKQARVGHLESICDRGKTLSFPKPRLPRAKTKKVVVG